MSGPAPVRRERAWLLAILAAAILARLAYVYLQDRYGLMQIKLLGPDARRYLELADGIWRHGTFAYDGAHPIASDVPGYPLFLAGVRAAFGPSLAAIQLVQAALSSACVALVWWLGRRVFSPRAGLVAAGICALYPFAFFFVVTPLTETLFSFWLLLFLALFAAAEGPALELAAGLAAGLAAMCRPVAAGFAALLCLWGLIAPGRRRRAILLAVGVAVVVLPWTARNLSAFGQLIPLTTRGGYEFYVGNGPGATGGSGGHHSRGVDIRMPSSLPPGLDDAARGGELMRRALAHIAAEPGRFIALLPAKVWNMWRPTWANASFKNWLLAGVPYVVILALAVVGLLARPWQRPAWFLAGLPLYYLVFHALFFGIIRYRAPVEPVLCLWAGAGLVWLRERLGSGGA